MHPHGHICTPYCNHYGQTPGYPMHSSVHNMPMMGGSPPPPVPMMGGSPPHMPMQYYGGMPMQMQQDPHTAYLQERVAQLEDLVQRRLSGGAKVTYGAKRSNPFPFSKRRGPSPYSYLQNKVFGMNGLPGGASMQDVKTFFERAKPGWQLISGSWDTYTGAGKWARYTTPQFDPFGEGEEYDWKLGVFVTLAAMANLTQAWNYLTAQTNHETGATQNTNRDNALLTIIGLAKAYNTVAYHNEKHASGLVNMLGMFLKAMDGRGFLTNQEMFCILLAGLGHDAYHPGWDIKCLVLSNYRVGARKAAISQANPMPYHFEDLHAAVAGRIITETVGADFFGEGSIALVQRYIGYTSMARGAAMLRDGSFVAGLNEVKQRDVYTNMGARAAERKQLLEHLLIHCADVSMFARNIVLAFKEVGPVLTELFGQYELLTNLIRLQDYGIPKAARLWFDVYNDGWMKLDKVANCTLSDIDAELTALGIGGTLRFEDTCINDFEAVYGTPLAFVKGIVGMVVAKPNNGANLLRGQNGFAKFIVHDWDLLMQFMELHLANLGEAVSAPGQVCMALGKELRKNICKMTKATTNVHVQAQAARTQGGLYLDGTNAHPEAVGTALNTLPLIAETADVNDATPIFPWTVGDVTQ